MSNAPPSWLLPAHGIGEADRARAGLLTLAGWTSPKIAKAFSVREDTVRLWRSDFTAGGRRGAEGQHRARAASGEK